MHIMILVGGSNEPSNSDFLADRFAEGVRSAGDAQITKIRVKDLHIDPFEMKHYDPATDQGEDFRRIETLVKEADGVLIATPIWNFGIPGNLKNLIDRMGSFCLDTESRSLGTLGGKPFFLLYTGGTPVAAWYGLQKKTVSHLPTAIRYFGATVIGTYYEERCTKGRGQFGLVVDGRPASIAAVKEKGKHFAGIVTTFAKTGSLPVRERFLVWLFKTGQSIKKKLGL